VIGAYQVSAGLLMFYPKRPLASSFPTLRLIKFGYGPQVNKTIFVGYVRFWQHIKRAALSAVGASSQPLGFKVAIYFS
jgi:hypothetical protein